MSTRYLLRGMLSVALLGASTGIIGCGPSDMPDMIEVTQDFTATGDMAKAKPDSGGGQEDMQDDMEIVQEDMDEADMPDVDAAEDGGDVDAAMPDGPDVDMPPPGNDGGDDGGPAKCDNNTKSCGAPGMCVDCSGNTVGTQCINDKCGCNTSADCQKGYACDPNKKTCSDSCAGGLVCNGGCCNGMNCVDGLVNGVCGSDGMACKACGGGTPSCDNGVCSAKCVVGKPGDPGACGMGFCCGGNNQCAAISDKACAVAGGACVDCMGAACLMAGTCGCTKPEQCPLGQACGKDGKCSTTCDAMTACNGGCCSAGLCVVGNTGSACATGVAACTSCVGNAAGAGCVVVNMKTQCGCATEKDCKIGQACNPVTKVCGTVCDTNTPCNGGCCSAAMNGACQVGTGNTACGASGALCANCTTGNSGKVCVAAPNGGVCGCKVLGDCPITATACTMGLCDTKCDANKPCQAGCCSNGTCVNGTANAACGASGVCVDCAGNAKGFVCQANKVCGCATAKECPVLLACDTAAKACTKVCSRVQPCSSGCCSNQIAGTCLAGDQKTACGDPSVPACLDCSANVDGRICVGGKCACKTSADCGALQACNVAAGKCVSICNANQLCNGGCCLNGTCVVGTANSACGGTGGACVGCKDGKPTCRAGACTANCGALADGICATGNCCSAGMCVPGGVQGACGYSGVCRNCKGQSNGEKCIAPNNNTDWFCGCEAKADCLLANPQAGLAGYACDTVNKSCTSLCGVGNTVTGCNGGCCSGMNGQCRPGNADAACGVNGGFCNNCGSACNPGPKCNAMNGSCGCSLPGVFPGPSGGDCFTLNCFNAGNRVGCNTAGGSCCITGTPGANNDTGNKALCCTGASTNGACTCLPAPMNTGNPASSGKCCSLAADGQGNCTCRANGASAGLFSAGGPAFVNAAACCSGRINAQSNCVCSANGQTAQTLAGCCANLRLVNGVCIP